MYIEKRTIETVMKDIGYGIKVGITKRKNEWQIGWNTNKYDWKQNPDLPQYVHWGWETYMWSCNDFVGVWRSARYDQADSSAAGTWISRQESCEPN